MRVEPDRTVLRDLVEERLLLVPTISGVLQDELGSCSVGGGEEERGAPRDFVRSA